MSAKRTKPKAQKDFNSILPGIINAAARKSSIMFKDRKNFTELLKF
jgi:hypothetical protein